MGARVKGISYNNADLRIKNGNLYLRIKPGQWIRYCWSTVSKLRRIAHEQGYNFDFERRTK